MARYFDITALTTLISLDAERKGVASLTVTNATNASIRGDAIVIPKSGAKQEWFTIERASRHYDPGASEQLSVAIDAGMDAAPATYGFQVRVLLGGGVPEEQFDDGPLVKFDVEEIPDKPQPPTPTPKKPFPWWIVAIIVGAIAALLIGVAIWFFVIRKPPLTGDDVRIVSSTPGTGTTLRAGVQTVLQFTVQYSLSAASPAFIVVNMADFPGATSCATSGFSTSGGGYQPVPAPNGEVTVNVLWSGGAGRTAPRVTLYSSGFSMIHEFDPDNRYCYTANP